MNKIDKIKNYNQIILAIVGTIGVVFIFFAALFTLVEMSDTFFRNDDNSNNGILAIEETDKLLQDSLRKQIITFNRIQIIDSISQTYLLPVTQANLVDAESTNELLGLMNKVSSSLSYEDFNYNIYNNLILYSSLTGRSKAIFDTRKSLGNFIVHESNNEKYIVIPACSFDSNKNGFLDDGDLQELFIYALENDNLHRLKLQENYTTLSVFQPNKSNDLIVHFGIDRNKNGKFERSKEPMIFYKVNLVDMSLEEFVSEADIIKMQELLEGK